MEKEYVWYACYGSNLCRSKFIERYINECTDRTPPKEDRPYIIRHQMYFAGRFGRWNGGVAFVSTKADEQAQTLGRVYRITMEQLDEVREKEGPSSHWYGNKLYLGMLEGLPVYTLTRDPQYDGHETRVPSPEYQEVIQRGLKEIYPQVDGKAYLRKTIEYTQSIM